jgi:hypothetical protein
MPDRPGWITLPATFFDPTISDADLQDQWTSGAEGAYRRLLFDLADAVLDAAEQSTAARWRVVVDLYDKAAKARAFVDEAQKNAARYRQAEAEQPAERVVVLDVTQRLLSGATPAVRQQVEDELTRMLGKTVAE